MTKKLMVGRVAVGDGAAMAIVAAAVLAAVLGSLIVFAKLLTAGSVTVSWRPFWISTAGQSAEAW